MTGNRATAYLAVGSGAGLGALLRYAVGLAVVGGGLPILVATIVVNVLGSLLIGAFATLSAPGGRLQVGPATRQFVMAGFCGGLTTFSAMSLETLDLVQGGETMSAFVYLIGLVAASLLAVWAGHQLAVRLAHRARP